MKASRAADPMSLAVLIAASLAVFCAVPAQYLGRQQDDLLYIISSQALAAGGYRLFTTPGQPPIDMITPGLPLLLLPATWLFGGAIWAYQALAALLLAAVPWLIWSWLRRRADETTALLIAALFATSPLVLSQAGTVMSEGAYTLCAMLLMLTLESKDGGGKAGLLLLALTQLRPAALSLVPAALLRPLLRRQWGPLAWTTLPALIGGFFWTAWSWAVSGRIQELAEWRLSYHGNSWLHPLFVAKANLLYYAAALGGCFLPPSFPPSLKAALGLALFAVAAAGCAKLLRKDSSEPAVWLLAGGAAMHGLWAWQYERYLIPLLAWLLWTAAAALGRRAKPVLGLLLAAQLVFHSWRFIAGPNDLQRVELVQTYAWLREHSGSADIPPARSSSETATTPRA